MQKTDEYNQLNITIPGMLYCVVGKKQSDQMLQNYRRTTVKLV